MVRPDIYTRYGGEILESGAYAGYVEKDGTFDIISDEEIVHVGDDVDVGVIMHAMIKQDACWNW